MILFFYRLYWQLRYFFLPPKKSLQREPVLSYGGFCSSTAKPSHGGNVKLIILSQVFTPNERECNLLYLVSSGINVRVQVWADACLKKGIPLIWNQNGIAYPAWTSDYKRLNARMASFLHRASFVCYQSHFCKQTSDQFLGSFKGPSEILYNAVDTSFFSPVEGKGDNNKLRLLVMGSHEHPGRVITALKATAALKNSFDVQLNIVGRLVWPNAQETINHIVKDLGLQDMVIFRGPYTQQEAPEIYRAADILLHLKHADPCPSVVIEAMACGLPVIGLNSGGMPELVGQEAGALVPIPNDLERIYMPEVGDVVHAVEKIKSQHIAYCHAARQRAVEHFDKKFWLQRHQVVFERIARSL